MAVRALECAAESQPAALSRFLPRRFFKDRLATLPVCGLDRVHDARPIFSADGNAVQKHKHWQREVQIEQRLGRGELEDPALLPQAIEPAGTQLGQPRLQRFRVRRIAAVYHRLGLSA